MSEKYFNPMKLILPVHKETDLQNISDSELVWTEDGNLYIGDESSGSVLIGGKSCSAQNGSYLYWIFDVEEDNSTIFDLGVLSPNDEDYKNYIVQAGANILPPDGESYTISENKMYLSTALSKSTSLIIRYFPRFYKNIAEFEVGNQQTTFNLPFSTTENTSAKYLVQCGGVVLIPSDYTIENKVLTLSGELTEGMKLYVRYLG